MHPKEFFLILFTLKVAEAQIPILTCELPIYYVCRIYNVSLLQDQPRYKIEVPFPAGNISEVLVGYSKLAVISPDFCETFVGMTRFLAHSQGVEYLDPEAFKSCVKIREVFLDGNFIQVLPQKLFWNNLKLELVDLANNRIGAISDDQFLNNVKLQVLYLSRNYLRAFPVSSVRNCTYFWLLNLSTNELTSLEIEKLAELEEFRALAINGNTFPCSSLVRYLRFAEATNRIRLTEEHAKRKKDFQMTYVENHLCVEGH